MHSSGVNTELMCMVDTMFHRPDLWSLARLASLEDHTTVDIPAALASQTDACVALALYHSIAKETLRDDIVKTYTQTKMVEPCNTTTLMRYSCYEACKGGTYGGFTPKTTP
eukprot:5688091-Amphidinium_carterae.1